MVRWKDSRVAGQLEPLPQDAREHDNYLGPNMLQVFTLRDTTCHEVVKRVLQFHYKISLGSGIRCLTFLSKTVTNILYWAYKPGSLLRTGYRYDHYDYQCHFCYSVIDYAEPLFNIICCCVYVDYHMIWILCFNELMEHRVISYLHGVIS
jgi:hypothetical protein